MDKRRPRSETIYERAKQIIPGGVNSPVRALKGFGILPVIVERGHGAIIEDVDGNQYIDYCCGWGALIHGHNPGFIVEALQTQLKKGSSFGITTEIEVEIAEKVVALLPSIEMIRFVSSGTEALMSAIRLAKTATGRSTILKFEGHYHGHSDALLIRAGSGVSTLPNSTSQGIASAVQHGTLSLPFNDFAACRRVLRSRQDIAAVVLEPVTANMGVVLPERGFLEMLREETLTSGALLIFDEVVTGFRLGLQGAQGLFGITPDLTCLGKVVGGGFPAAAYGGKKKWMEYVAPLGKMYQAGTLSGFPLAMAAGKAAITGLEEPEFFIKLAEMARRLVTPIRASIQRKRIPVAVTQIGSMLTIFFGKDAVTTYADLQDLDQTAFVNFFCHMLARGIYLPPAQSESWFLSAAHTAEQIDQTVAGILEFFDIFYH
jgi:glutamate-1-semialdehyde 2,1-aminomutase